MAESLALKGMAKEDKRAYILEKSLQCLAEYGYTHTTLDLIAEKVNVSKGTISYYFKNKEGLIAESLDFAGNRILADFQLAIDKVDTPAEKIHAGLIGLWTDLSVNHGAVRVYYDLFAQGLFSDRLRQLLAKLTHKFRVVFVDLLRENNNGSAPDSEENILIKAAMLGCLVDGIVKQMIIDPEAFAAVDVQAGVENLFHKICEHI